jgi:hypothetical protein
METVDKVVSSFVSNGMYYTVTCRPIVPEDFISLRTYLGYKPSREIAEQVAQVARRSKQPYITEHVTTPNYTGLILKYSHSFLQEFFTSKQQQVTQVNSNTIEDDDLPF